MRRLAVERFMAKVTRNPDGCWLWEGGTTGPGYGRFFLSGATVLPHRFAYEQFVGPIPDGLQIDHLCRNPNCVNPDHLEPVTARMNVRRGVSPAALNAAKNYCKNGHEFDTVNTYVTPDGRRQCRVCRDEASRRYKARQLVGATGG